VDLSDGDDTEPTDEQILDRIRGGELDSFGDLVRRYERELYGYLRRFVGHDELAADVFQNTFVQVFTKIGKYESGRPARPWIYAIATNQAIDALRRRGRRPDGRADGTQPGTDPAEESRPIAEATPDSRPGPPEQVATAETRDRVRAAVANLPDTFRDVVALTYFQGLKYQEVADSLGIPLGTVKSRLHAALTKLAETWDGPNPFPATD
jgi:RNA polymerase sigma-70 factor (ECF subfamily)